PPPPKLPYGALQLAGVQHDARHGLIKLRVDVPGRGTLTLHGARVRGVRRAVTHAGPVTLLVRPRHALLAALRRHGHLRVRVRITFRPAGGSARTLTRALTLVRTHQPTRPL